MTDTNKARLLKDMFPDINWDQFEDIDRALNFELWFGTSSEYFAGETPAEDLEHYTWEGLEKACKDIEEILEPIPYELWYDIDGGECLTDSDPQNYEPYWTYECKFCDEWLITEDGKVWSDSTDGDCCSGNRNGENENQPHVPDYNTGEWRGGDWEKFNVRKALMFDETYKQVF